LGGALRVERNDGLSANVRLAADDGSGSKKWLLQNNPATYAFTIRDENADNSPIIVYGGGVGGTLVVNSGKVGVGTANPVAPLHVRVDGTSDPAFMIEGLNQSDSLSLKLQHPNAVAGMALAGGAGAFFSTAAQDDAVVFAQAGKNLLLGIGGTESVRITSAGAVGIGTTNPQGMLDVNGPIYQYGTVPLHADYVFEAGFELESIEEHGLRMWSEKHLPAVPARRTDGEGREVVELGGHQRGILEELEIAHIYIEQLNAKLAATEQKVQELAARFLPNQDTAAAAAAGEAAAQEPVSPASATAPQGALEALLRASEEQERRLEALAAENAALRARIHALEETKQ